MNQEPLLTGVLWCDLSENLLDGLIRREVHGRERRIHEDGRPIRGVKRLDSFVPQHPHDAVPHPAVRAPAELEPLLDDVHWSQQGVAGDGGGHTGGSVDEGVVAAVLAVAAETVLAELVDCEVGGVGRTGAKAYGGNAAVEAGGALRADDGREQAADGGVMVLGRG